MTSAGRFNFLRETFFINLVTVGVEAADNINDVLSCFRVVLQC